MASSVSIRNVKDEGYVDYADVVRRSPVATDPDALKHLLSFVGSSHFSYVGRINGDVACVYGLVLPSLLSGTAYIWLLTTDTAVENSFLFIRHSQLVIERILADYERIILECKADDHRAIRWMRWLGATLTFRGKTFKFEITRDSFARR